MNSKLYTVLFLNNNKERYQMEQEQVSGWVSSVGMPQSPQMFYGSLLELGKRSNSVSFWFNVWSMKGHCICSCSGMSFGWRTSYIRLSYRPQNSMTSSFHDMSLFEKLIGKSRDHRNEAFIRRSSPCTSYKLWNKNVIGEIWNIPIHESKVCNKES